MECVWQFVIWEILIPKHRSTVFTVVREQLDEWEGSFGDYEAAWTFHGLVGTYETLGRAEEVAAATVQAYLDAGMDEAQPNYRCTVHTSTWYEE